ncbi:hypothetical protein, partial [uncultured Cetobacterium sp.]
MKKVFLWITYFLLSLIFLLPFIGIFLNSMNFKMWKYVLTSGQTYNSLLTTFLVALITMFINFII